MNRYGGFDFDDIDGYDDCEKKGTSGCLLDDEEAEWWDPDDFPDEDEGDEEHC